jgi:phosphoglycolate phosphatase-like HAD superfamily hydrolase
MKIGQFESIIFDCDGVILNSNKIKSQAFYDTVSNFGDLYARQLVDYNIKNGGVSRNDKFKYFKNFIYPNSSSIKIEDLLTKFSSIVSEKLLTCEVAFGLDIIKEKTPNSRWSVVSGGNENELKWVFNKLNLYHLFDDGIYGSPLNKYDIISSGQKVGHFSDKVLFIGDSKLDFEVAKFFNFNFVFVKQWTEFANHESFCQKNQILSVNAPIDILNVNF